MSSDAGTARRILEKARTIAVLGAHCEDHKAACYVPEYLAEKGYRVIAVNPRFEGEEMFGGKAVAHLADIHEPVDVVDVFRRSEHLPGHVADILAMSPLPKAVWFQAGIVNEDVARELEREGIEVVQDRCTLADHQRFGLSRAS